MDAAMDATRFLTATLQVAILTPTDGEGAGIGNLNHRVIFHDEAVDRTAHVAMHQPFRCSVHCNPVVGGDACIIHALVWVVKVS